MTPLLEMALSMDAVDKGKFFWPELQDMEN